MVSWGHLSWLCLFPSFHTPLPVWQQKTSPHYLLCVQHKSKVQIHTSHWEEHKLCCCQSQHSLAHKHTAFHTAPVTSICYCHKYCSICCIGNSQLHMEIQFSNVILGILIPLHVFPPRISWCLFKFNLEMTNIYSGDE